MSMILYHGEPNGPSFTALAALAESGLKVECRHIDLLKGERHTIPGITEPLARDMGVEGEGPVLVVDGEALTESVFIAQYLDEAAGGCGLQPQEAYTHWRMMMWCRRITERAAPAAAFLGCRATAHAPLAAMADAGFTTLAGAIVSEDLRARWSAVRAGDFPEEQLADSRAKIADAAAMVEDQLADGRDWLMGAFSIADLESFGWLTGMAELEGAAFAGKPRLAAWLERLRARPGVQWALAKARTTHPAQSWAPGPEINRWG